LVPKSERKIRLDRIWGLDSHKGWGRGESGERGSYNVFSYLEVIIFQGSGKNGVFAWMGEYQQLAPRKQGKVSSEAS